VITVTAREAVGRPVNREILRWTSSVTMRPSAAPLLGVTKSFASRAEREAKAEQRRLAALQEAATKS